MDATLFQFNFVNFHKKKCFCFMIHNICRCYIRLEVLLVNV
ncbi:hypothetical protein OIU74_000560 [Salix koriyanagi]|uniref:Uncharacterized protein n=1 Tax=Salix koriyanagi TaxID=2511006 RepID=A0A9Q0X081_9ROSI|nr:hypothetical protein OIU74_000560 [Salix koriyanagi]